jgi:hypothetical protein
LAQPDLESNSNAEPVALFSSSDAPFNTINDLTCVFDRFAQLDDVFCPDFANAVIVQTPSGVPSIVDRLILQADSTSRFPIARIYSLEAKSINDLLPSGPYFLVGCDIHQAWRVYPDVLDAFITTVIPDSVTNVKR